MHLKIILIVIVSCLALIFTIQNVTAATVSIFFWEFSLSLALLIFFILILGFLIGWFLHSFLAYRRDKKYIDEVEDVEK